MNEKIKDETKRDRGGFILTYTWVLDELESKPKALSLYLFLLKKCNRSQQPFIFYPDKNIQDRFYTVLAGEYATSYRRLKSHLKLSLPSIESAIKTLKEVGAIEMRRLIYEHKSGKNGFDGLIFTILTPFHLDTRQYKSVTGGSDKPEHTPVSNCDREEGKSVRTYLYLNDLDLKELNLKELEERETRARAHAPAHQISDSSDFFQEGDQQSAAHVPEDRKNTPPEAKEWVSSTFTPKDLFRLWNELSGALPKCRVLSEKRKRQCRARIKENSSQEYWRTVIENLSKSTFALEGGWCSFDWIIKNLENGEKAFNGNYNRSFKSSPKDESDIPGTLAYFRKHEPEAVEWALRPVSVDEGEQKNIEKEEIPF